MDGSEHPTSVMIPAWVDGALTPVEKLAVHQRGLRHPAVSVFVLREGAILLQQRALCKYHTPGLWANTCCTHPNWGEDPLHCANRRLMEELGLSGLTLSHRGQVSYSADVGDGLFEDEVVEVFTAEAPADLLFEPNPEEVMDVRWVRPADLSDDIARDPSAFTPWLRIYLAQHSEMIFG